uniref:Uncharacterized protein n=1 Tax=Aegilops tauschii subsp. strangulata TaxID=200361 RepID=A0A453C6V2_AEGTS
MGIRGSLLEGLGLSRLLVLCLRIWDYGAGLLVPSA